MKFSGPDWTTTTYDPSETFRVGFSPPMETTVELRIHNMKTDEYHLYRLPYKNQTDLSELISKLEKIGTDGIPPELEAYKLEEPK